MLPLRSIGVAALLACFACHWGTPCGGSVGGRGAAQDGQRQSLASDAVARGLPDSGLPSARPTPATIESLTPTGGTGRERRGEDLAVVETSSLLRAAVRFKSTCGKWPGPKWWNELSTDGACPGWRAVRPLEKGPPESWEWLMTLETRGTTVTVRWLGADRALGGDGIGADRVCWMDEASDHHETCKWEGIPLPEMP
jgi:hypothetical protein